MAGFLTQKLMISIIIVEVLGLCYSEMQKRRRENTVAIHTRSYLQKKEKIEKNRTWLQKTNRQTKNKGENEATAKSV